MTSQSPFHILIANAPLRSINFNKLKGIKMDMFNRELVEKSMTILLVSLLAMPFEASAANEEEIQYCLNESSGIHFIGEKMIVVSRTPLAITGDRKALDRAFIKAELRAKGILIRDMAETHSSNLNSTDSSEDSTGSKQLIDENGILTSSEVTSKQKDALTIIENNISTGSLVGVRKFEELYSPDKGEVCVAIGVSAETINQSNKFKNMMSNPDQARMKKTKSNTNTTLKSFYRRSAWK